MAVGTGESVFATLRNISKKRLKFSERKTVFVLTAETRPGEHSRRGCAVFPTTGNNVEDKAYSPDQKLILLPGESYTVFWDLHTNGCKGYDYGANNTPWWTFQWFAEFSERSTFQSGNYKIIFDAEFQVDPEAEEHKVTKVIEAKFSASQSIILAGAALGGFVAFIVKLMLKGSGETPNSETPTPPPASMTENAGPTIAAPNRSFAAKTLAKDWLLPFLASGMLSMTLVILGTQIADTGFPVKVDASNFIGAFTAGFLLNFAGLKLIRQLAAADGRSPEPGTSSPGGRTPLSGPSPELARAMGSGGSSAMPASASAAAAGGRIET
jgi:hypothetical protein